MDADIIDRLIQKEDEKKSNLTDMQRDNLSAVFQSQVPKGEKAEFLVEVDALGEQASPVIITQNEWMRRMKEMSRYQSGMGFYGQMPDSYNLVLNSDHRLVKQVLGHLNAQLSDQLKGIESEIKGLEARQQAIEQMQSKKKPEEITQEEKDDKQNTEKKLDEERNKRTQLIADYGKDEAVVHQLIDLALLQNGMLKGAALDRFLSRSVELIKAE